MKILLTGATGLVGQALSVELLKLGHTLIVVSRENEKTFRERFSLPCQYVSWAHLSDPSYQPNELTQVDAVVNLAGESIAEGTWTQEKKRKIYESRVLGTQLLVKAVRARKWQPKVLISASAIGYYGDRADEILDESSGPGEGFLAEVCRDWESAAMNLKDQVPVALLRIGVVLSPTGGFLEEMKKIYSRGAGGVIGSGLQWLSWVHLDDLIKLILFIINHPSPAGAWNGVAPKAVMQSEFNTEMAKASGHWGIAPAPVFAIKALLGEKSALALHSQRVASKRATEGGFRFQYSELSAAMQDLFSWKRTSNDQLFRAGQWVAQPIVRVFEFFSEAGNLERITPPWLNFQIKSMNTESIQRNSQIQYRLKLHGVPLSWTTLIEEWQPPTKFVDTQLSGPFSLWHHTHSFSELAHGTWIQDQVVYRLPVASVSRLVAGSWVGSDVKKIFNYRQSVIREIFQS